MWSSGNLSERSGGSITEGIGQGRVTDNLKQEINLITDPLSIPDQEKIEMVYRLLDEEGLCLGASTSLNVVAAYRLAQKIGPGKTVAVRCMGRGPA